MIFPGHIASAYLAAHYGRLDERAALIAAVAPDIVDKSVRYLLWLTPNGRIPLHSLLVAAGLSLLVWLLFRRRPAIVLGWLAGYATHLLADVITDAIHWGPHFEYLLWPLLPAQTSRYLTIYSRLLDQNLLAFALEAIVTAWGAAVFWRVWRARRAAGQPASDLGH